MQCPSKKDEHLREEKGEVVEPKLPPNDGTDHEQPRTAQDHRRQKNDDLGMGGGRCVWGE